MCIHCIDNRHTFAFMKRYTFFIEIEMIRKLRKEAKAKGFGSVSAYIRKIIFDHLGNEKP